LDELVFGSPMAARTLTPDNYRYGFNGQEKDDEVSGAGNTMTAEYWEYDTRLGRRWNLDPKPTVGISDYAAFGLNPILNNDPKGDFKTKFGAYLYKAFHGGTVLRNTTEGDVRSGQYYVQKISNNKPNAPTQDPKTGITTLGEVEVTPEHYDWGANDKKVINGIERFGENAEKFGKNTKNVGLAATTAGVGTLNAPLTEAGAATYAIGAGIETTGTAAGIVADIANENYVGAAIKAVGVIISTVTGKGIDAAKGKGVDELGKFGAKVGADAAINEAQNKVEKKVGGTKDKQE